MFLSHGAQNPIDFAQFELSSARNYIPVFAQIRDESVPFCGGSGVMKQPSTSIKGSTPSDH